MNSISIDNALDRYSNYIKINNIRRSHDREIILRTIIDLDSHFTATSLTEAVLKQIHISQATIYNSLKLFSNAGLIIHHPFNKNEDEYEAIWRASTHHHRICTECGVIKEFTDKKIQTPIKNKHFNAFEKHHSAVYLYGLCKRCINKRNKLLKKL